MPQSNPPMRMPPPGTTVQRKHIIALTPWCVALHDGERFSLEIGDPGEFFCYPSGYFEPELPLGFHSTTPEKTYKPLKTGQLTITYLDDKTGHVYVQPIVIVDWPNEC